MADSVHNQSNQCTLIIPVFNERGCLRPLLEEIFASGHHRKLHEILIVDDGSTDGTAESVAGMAGVRVVRHERNLGYGFAIRTGILNATTTHFIKFDGDGQHPPDCLGEFIEALRDKDYVAGVRYRMDIPRTRRLGNILLTATARLLFGFPEPDLTSGYYGARRHLTLSLLETVPEGFGFTAHFRLSMLCRAERVGYVRYLCRPRPTGTASKLRPVADGLRVLLAIAAIGWRHARLRLLTLAGILVGAIALSIWAARW